MYTVVIITISVFVGFILGAYKGWEAGKIRTRRLLSLLTANMERLRQESRIKAERKNTYLDAGCVSGAQYLEDELHAESAIFMNIQYTISDWCINHDEKDPFAI